MLDQYGDRDARCVCGCEGDEPSVIAQLSERLLLIVRPFVGGTLGAFADQLRRAGLAGDVAADLIVLGTQGLGGIQKWFFGSVAEKVLRDAAVPVLAVPLGGEADVTPRRIVASVDLDDDTVARAAVALGHTDAGYETARHAFDLGATHVVHLFDAMAPFHHREPGLVTAALLFVLLPVAKVLKPD